MTGQVATFGPTGALQCGSLPSTRTQLGGSSLNQGYDTIIVTPADGRPVVAFLAASSGTIVNLKVLKCGNAACSAGNISTFADITIRSDPFNGIGMAIPSDGLPVISYFDTVNQDLRVVKCGNASCSSGNTATSLDTFGSQGRYSSVAVGADGLPVISYWDGSNGHLKIAKCGNAFCTTASSITTADSAPNVGGYTSIAIPTDGRPVVAYNTYANAPSGNGAGVKVLKCANAACTGTPTITPVETVSNSGRYISLAIGADGLPVVAYQFLGTAGFAPKVVKCGNSACSSGNTLTEVDVGTQNGGQFASIAVPADGRPVLVHSDTPLRFVRCGNASCSSGNQATYLVGDNGGAFSRRWPSLPTVCRSFPTTSPPRLAS